MKKSVLVVLVMGAGLACAEEKKRPSWSQGLPDKKAVPVIQAPAVRHERSRPTFAAPQLAVAPLSLLTPSNEASDAGSSRETESVNHDSQQAAKPTPRPASNAGVVPKNADAQTLEKINDQATEQTTATDSEPVAAEAAVTVDQADNAYSWTLQRQFPIKVSSAWLRQYDRVLLKVMINSQGQVVQVDRVTADTPEPIIDQASRSLKRWRFAAPVDEGIEQGLLARVFEVPLAAR